jgi:Mg2+/Co2+ transporter CorB
MTAVIVAVSMSVFFSMAVTGVVGVSVFRGRSGVAAGALSAGRVAVVRLRRVMRIRHAQLL